ncbi:hypothetical protein [Crenalkalicoccus roseus]|uniref:hypothetical protein n=1 Tax=Crenalkalicoccus roseus TaxID=1485588 RepID=UPI0010809BBF|nr:hypothetical protein [Crenalkalicoccus roseus]
MDLPDRVKMLAHEELSVFPTAGIGLRVRARGWKKVGQSRRPRTVDSLRNAIGSVPDAFIPDECRNRIADRGYSHL